MRVVQKLHIKSIESLEEKKKWIEDTAKEEGLTCTHSISLTSSSILLTTTFYERSSNKTSTISR